MSDKRTRVRIDSTIAVPLGFAFDYVADFRNGSDWVFGMSGVEVVGERQHGLGTVYAGAIKLGPSTLRADSEIVRWEPPQVVAFESVRGFVNRSTWAFNAIDPETTALAADIEYELPGGPAGRLLGKALEPFVSISLRQSDRALRERLELDYQWSRSRPGSGSGSGR